MLHWTALPSISGSDQLLINIRSLMSIRSYCLSTDLYIATVLKPEQANKPT